MFILNFSRSNTTVKQSVCAQSLQMLTAILEMCSKSRTWLLKRLVRVINANFILHSFDNHNCNDVHFSYQLATRRQLNSDLILQSHLEILEVVTMNPEISLLPSRHLNMQFNWNLIFRTHTTIWEMPCEIVGNWMMQFNAIDRPLD